MRANTYEEIKSALKLTIPRNLKKADLIFACIGTDRSTGDCLGPLIGKDLKKAGFNVIGTIDEPLHAINLDKRMASEVDSSKTIIGIDACLGLATSVGAYDVKAGPVHPGAGVDKQLSPVGDYHITGIVNVGGYMEYFVLQNTKLSLVMNMAENITNAIKAVWSDELEIVSSN